MDIKKFSRELPVRSEMITWVEFVQLTEIHPTLLGDLIDLGWLDPVKTSHESYLFRVGDVYRVRKLDRICKDFELSSIGGSIIVDLLSRIEYLEQKIRDMERLLQP